MKANIVYGLHAVSALLHNHPERIVALSVLAGRDDQKIQPLIESARLQSIRINTVDRATLDRLSDNANHQGILAECREMQQAVTLEEIVASATSTILLLILDGVQDPHNLGAILRTADAAGVAAVIAPKDKSVGITPVVSKVACGAAETVPFFQVTNLARTLIWLKENNIWLYGAEAKAQQTIYQANLTGRTGLVLGGEGKGLRRLTSEHCDVLVNIPMQGSVASLNVSVATGICLFEAVRQRAK